MCLVAWHFPILPVLLWRQPNFPLGGHLGCQMQLSWPHKDSPSHFIGWKSQKLCLLSITQNLMLCGHKPTADSGTRNARIAFPCHHSVSQYWRAFSSPLLLFLPYLARLPDFLVMRYTLSQRLLPKKLFGEKGNEQPLHSRAGVLVKSAESWLISSKSMGKWGWLRVECISSYF